MRKRLINSVRYFLLLLYITYYVGGNLFPHTHEINGQRIVHSHLYGTKDAGGNPVHNHSESAANAISTITNTPYIGGDIIFFSAILAHELAVIESVYNDRLSYIQIDFCEGRAPPIG